MQETWTPTEEELSTLDSHVSWHRLLVEHGQVLVDQGVVSHCLCTSQHVVLGRKKDIFEPLISLYHTSSSSLQSVIF